MAKLAQIKTKETNLSVKDFIEKVPEEQKRKDSFTILKTIEKITKEKPRMWGTSIVGFGKKIYKSPASGREVEWFIVGFSPRKANLTLYLGVNGPMSAASLKKLGKHKAGGGCVYINKLEDIDMKVLEEMIMATLKRK